MVSICVNNDCNIHAVWLVRLGSGDVGIYLGIRHLAQTLRPIPVYLSHPAYSVAPTFEHTV